MDYETFNALNQDIPIDEGHFPDENFRDFVKSAEADIDNFVFRGDSHGNNKKKP